MVVATDTSSRQRGWLRPPATSTLVWLCVRVLVVLVLLALWQLLTATGVVNSHEFPTAAQTLSDLAGQLGARDLWTGVAQTLQSWFVGLLLSALIGIPLGFLFGTSEPVYQSCRLLVDFFRTIPAVTVIPVALLLYGNTIRMKLVLVVFACVWIFLIQAMYGIRDVDPVVRETARSYRFRRHDVLARLVLPSTLPYLMTAFRVASVVALLLSIGAELITSAPGLGQDILLAQSGGDLRRLYALIIVAGLLGVVINVAFGLIEKMVLRWHPSRRSGNV